MNREINAYVYPEGLIPIGTKSPRFVKMESIYKNEEPAIIRMAGLQGEEGTVFLEGSAEIKRATKWGTQCHWCKKKYFLANILIIVDEDGVRSVMCPSCYKSVMETQG